MTSYGMLIALALVSAVCRRLVRSWPVSARPSSAQSRRPLQPDDIFALKTVGDPRISPDGAWVAYTVSSFDKKEDNSDTDIYMVRGGRRRADPADEQQEAGERRRGGARTAATSRSCRRATARSRRCSCSIAAAATRSRSPTTRPARRPSRGRPTARSWRCSSPDPDPNDPDERRLRRQGQEAEAARHHAPAVHARRRRLPERRQAPHPRLRHRDEEATSRSPPPVRRWRAGVVAGRLAHRLQRQPHRQPRRERNAPPTISGGAMLVCSMRNGSTRPSGTRRF